MEKERIEEGDERREEELNRRCRQGRERLQDE